MNIYIEINPNDLNNETKKVLKGWKNFLPIHRMDEDHPFLKQVKSDAKRDISLILKKGLPNKFEKLSALPALTRMVMINLDDFIESGADDEYIKNFVTQIASLDYIFRKKYTEYL